MGKCISKRKTVGGDMSKQLINVYGRTVDISTPGGRVAHQILRQCELMDQAGAFINTSNNLETVLRNIPIYEKSLLYLASCSDHNLKALHLKSSHQLRSMYDNWIKQKPGAINSGIKRATLAAVEHAKTLKTDKGKIKSLYSFVDKSLALPGLFPENIQALNSIKQAMDNKNKGV